MPGDTNGTIRTILEASSGRVVGHDLGLCYSPEFIALGSVIRDYLHPDMVLIGESDPKAGTLLEQVYRRVCRKEPVFSRMSFVNAELTKIAVNSFITTKITFANMIAGICQNLPGANVDTVTAALGCDSRIGRKYLKGAVAFGGPCFPRDNVALAQVARRCASSAMLAQSVHDSNQNEIARLADFVRRSLGETGQVVGILGLSYKPETDVIDESPGVYLAAHLSESGLPVIAYDPAANDHAKRALGSAVQVMESLEACVQEADVLVITTPWNEFITIGEVCARNQTGRRRTLIDCWRCVDTDMLDESTDYHAIGVGRVERERAPVVESSAQPGAALGLRVA
jgi:UDPglucose 6-dehydrogenase